MKPRISRAKEIECRLLLHRYYGLDIPQLPDPIEAEAYNKIGIEAAKREQQELQSHGIRRLTEADGPQIDPERYTEWLRARYRAARKASGLAPKEFDALVMANVGQYGQTSPESILEAADEVLRDTNA